MKKKAIQQLDNKPVEELKKNLLEKKERLWTLKSGLASGKVKNVREIRELKKDIARIATVLSNKQ